MVRINGKIRAREVRVIGDDGQQLGIMALSDAIRLAQSKGVDLVEIAATATPPVCRVVDYGKFRYEQSKREKESRKHQHANKMKEIQLSAGIDPHDFEVKVGRAIDFLCEEMKVKVSLRFRGREMAHTEFGFQVIEKFITAVAPYGHPDATPKLVGRGVNFFVSPLPRNKRAKNPHQVPGAVQPPTPSGATPPAPKPPPPGEPPASSQDSKPDNSPPDQGGFNNNPFSGLNLEE